MYQSILRINASMRKSDSYSRSLSDKLIKQLTFTDKIPVQVRELADGIPLIDENWIKANFTPEIERTSEQSKYLATSDILVDELSKADLVVIGLPIYNFGVPAVFKAWIDQVVRAKLTFQYSDDGPVGLLNNKKVYIIVASGGTKLGTEVDFISDYLKHILGFIGITDVTIIDCSGIGQNESETLAHAHQVIEQI